MRELTTTAPFSHIPPPTPVIYSRKPRVSESQRGQQQRIFLTHGESSCIAWRDQVVLVCGIFFILRSSDYFNRCTRHLSSIEVLGHTSLTGWDRSYVSKDESDELKIPAMNRGIHHSQFGAFRLRWKGFAYLPPHRWTSLEDDVRCTLSNQPEDRKIKKTPQAGTT